MISARNSTARSMSQSERSRARPCQDMSPASHAPLAPATTRATQPARSAQAAGVLDQEKCRCSQARMGVIIREERSKFQEPMRLVLEIWLLILAQGAGTSPSGKRAGTAQ